MQTPEFDKHTARRAGWIGLLTVATIMGSLLFACATPFPALAALAALHMNRRDAFILTGIIWVANQSVGYLFLHYPQTWDSFAWGLALGIGALIATGVAAGTERVVRPLGRASAILACFAVAFTAYELVLYVAATMLPTEPGAFGLPVVLYLLEINAGSLAGLLVFQYGSARLGLVPPRQGIRLARAAA